MNQTKDISIDPVAFSQWVSKVAAINERFSEALRDTAELVATIDPVAAIGLYQAADTANETVFALRQAIKPPLPVAPRQPSTTACYILAAVCGGVLGGLLSRF
jgi:LPS O-antigen subunit length determinant protein (WzzB/FepE family)